MKVQDAIAKQVADIEAQVRRREQLRISAQEQAERVRQEFIGAMQERLELQYGLELTPEDLAAWEVAENGGGHYRFAWHIDDDKGSVFTANNHTIREVSVGSESEVFVWWASREEKGNVPFANDLVAALTYAATGKRLS